MKKLAIEARAREGLAQYLGGMVETGCIVDFEVGEAIAAPVQDQPAHRLAMALMEGIGVQFEPEWNIVVEATVALYPPADEVHFQFLATTHPDTGDNHDGPAIS